MSVNFKRLAMSKVKIASRGGTLKQKRDGNVGKLSRKDKGCEMNSINII